MPLEDLTGVKYINSLNETWPAGTDFPDAGDDHLRGIKNVLKNSFPSINGALTRPLANINAGSVPVGANVLFFDVAAPLGWTRYAGIAATTGLRVVPSATPGGGTGGTDDPVLNAVVASHTHTFSATTDSTSVAHTHAVSITSGTESANHTHSVNDPGHTHAGSVLGAANTGAAFYTGGGLPAQGPASAVTGISLSTQSANHTHLVSGNTGSNSVAHTHPFSGDVAVNAGAANWTPRYMDMILCTRSAP